MKVLAVVVLILGSAGFSGCLSGVGAGGFARGFSQSYYGIPAYQPAPLSLPRSTHCYDVGLGGVTCSSY